MNLENRKFKVYLLRHGEIRSENCLVGQRNTPLTEEGLRQAHWWCRLFGGVELARIYCSDLDRCVRTAEIIAGTRQQPVERIPAFREIRLGDWEGLPVAEIARRFPDQWFERGAHLATYRPAGGESFEDLKERVIPAFDRIVSEANGDIMVVAHGGVNRVILCHLLEAPLDNVFRLGQDYGSLNLIEFHGGSFEISVVNMRPKFNGQFRIL